jgi:hypothetical protein
MCGKARQGLTKRMPENAKKTFFGDDDVAQKTPMGILNFA